MRAAQQLFRLVSKQNVCPRAASRTIRPFSTTPSVSRASLHQSYNVSQTVLDVDAAGRPGITTITPPTEDPSHPKYAMFKISQAINQLQAIGMPIKFNLCALAFSQVVFMAKSKALYLKDADRLFKEVKENGYKLDLRKKAEEQGEEGVELWLIGEEAGLTMEQAVTGHPASIYRLLWLNKGLREKAAAMEPPVTEACLRDSMEDSEYQEWAASAGLALEELAGLFIGPGKH